MISLPIETETDRFLIADVAALTDVPVHRLRSWERAGLLQPRRSAGDVRVYDREDVARARLIARSLVNPGRRGSLRRIAEQIASGELNPAASDYEGLPSPTSVRRSAPPADPWRQVVDALPALIAIWDEEGVLTYVNHTLQTMIGANVPSNGAPHHISDAMDEPITTLLTNALAPRWTARTGIAQHDITVSLPSSSGVPVRTVWQTVPLRTADGLSGGAVSIGHTFTASETDIRAREDQLANATRDLHASASITLGNLQLARRTMQTQIANSSAPHSGKDGVDRGVNATLAGQDRLTRHLEMAEVGMRELLRSLNTLLDATDAASGALLRQLIPERVDLSEVVRAAVAHAQSLTTRHHLVLDMPSEPLTMTGDQRRLRELIDNLLDNAVVYSPDGGSITITLQMREEHDHWPSSQGESRPPTHWCVLSVTDEGIGIPVTDLPHVFERYFRGSNVTSSVRGAGLGLFAVQAIARSHGGSAWIDQTSEGDEEHPDETDQPTPNSGRFARGTRIAVTLPNISPVREQPGRSGEEKRR